MRGDEAAKACPDIALVKVPELRGKADLTKYDHNLAITFNTTYSR